MKSCDGDQIECPCCKECKDCKGFQKVVDLKNAGLVIYRHTTCTEDANKPLNCGIVDFAAKITEDVFILHNTKDIELTPADYLSEIEQNKLNCPRCRRIIEHAQKLLQKVPTLNRNDVQGICEHCRTTVRKAPCFECKEIVKKFVACKSQRIEMTKQRVKQWLTKIKHLMKDAIVDTATGNERFRAHSELYIDQLCRESPKHGRKTDLRQMFQPESDSLDFAKAFPSSIKKRNEMFAHLSQFEKFESYSREGINLAVRDKAYVSVADSDILRTPLPTEKPKKEKHVELRENIPPVPFHSEQDIIERDETETLLKQIIRPKLPESLYTSDEEPDIKRYIKSSKVRKFEIVDTETRPADFDSIRQHVDKKVSKPDRRSEFDKIFSYGSTKVTKELNKNTRLSGSPYTIQKKHSDEALLTTVIGDKKDTIELDFSYVFPKMLSADPKKLKLKISSSELIKDTQDMLSARAEEAEKRKEEGRRKKLEEQDKKRIAREQRKKQLEAEKKRDEEKMLLGALEKNKLERKRREDEKEELKTQSNMAKKENLKEKVTPTASTGFSKINIKESSSSREKRESKPIETKDLKGLKEPIKSKRSREPIELQEPKELKETKAPRELKESKETKEPKEPMESKKPKEPKASKGPMELQEPKRPREPKEPQEPKKPKAPKELKETKVPIESKENKEQKSSKELLEPKRLKQSKEPQETKEPKAPKEIKETKVPIELKDAKVQKSSKELLEPKKLKQPKEPQKPKEPKAPKELKETKVPIESKEMKEQKSPKELIEAQRLKQSKEPQEPTELKALKELKEPKAPHESKETNEQKSSKELQESKRLTEPKDSKEPNKPEQRKESTAPKTPKESKTLIESKETTEPKGSEEPKERKEKKELQKSNEPTDRKVDQDTPKAKKEDKKEKDSELAKEKEEKVRLKKEKEEQLLHEKKMKQIGKELNKTEKEELLREKIGDQVVIKTRDNSTKQKEQGDKTKKTEKERVDIKAAEEARLKLKLAQHDEAKPEHEEPKTVKHTEHTEIKDLNIKGIKVRAVSYDDLILRLVRIKQSTRVDRVRAHRGTLGRVRSSAKSSRRHKVRRHKTAPVCIMRKSDIELDAAETLYLKKRKVDKLNIIIGQNIFKFKPRLKKKQKDLNVVPLLFQTKFDQTKEVTIRPPEAVKIPPVIITGKQALETYIDPEASKGVIRYALSDRSFIDKGWTMLPTEKVVRKMNVYRMRPAQPEFDWFEHNKNKRLMTYDTGEKLAEFDDNGRGRWFYKNGRMALDYYDAEELNANQRFVVYSSGEPDERGRTYPSKLLATFDYLGNGIVYDHNGKVRLKYNQTEGVVLDRNIGPESHWKWHTLNDPPVLQQVMIDTQMAHKDPQILKLGGPNEIKTRPENEDMLAIEFDNFIKEKSKKLTQSFKPFQIKMKALKINENFSLKVLDQATVYLIFRDGTTNLKLNIGMVLNHKEIVDTDTAELGEVSNNMERFPARTDSLAGLQRKVAHAQHLDRTRTERERRLRPPAPSGSADKLTAAASRPLRLPLRTGTSGSTTTATNCFCK